MGFVRDQLDFRANQPAYENGRINWVLPIALVDYFERRLAGDRSTDYDAFDAAQRNLEQALGDQATENHRKVLKALFLQTVAGLSAAKRKQAELLAHLSGLDENTTLQMLKELADRNIIRYDPIQVSNSFWPVGSDPQQLERAIREELERHPCPPEKQAEGLNQLLREDTSLYRFDNVPVEVEWGHSGDWAAVEYILTLDAPETVIQAKPLVRLMPHGLADGPRSVVVWMVMRNESERVALRERAEQLAETLSGDSGVKNPLPVLIMLPLNPVPELLELFVRLKALEAIGNKKDLVSNIGRQTYDTELARTRAQLVQALRELRGEADKVWDISRSPDQIMVPQAYQASIAAMRSPSARSVLKELYKLAYRHRPPAFFKQYSDRQTRGQSKLRTAVKNVAKNLVHDRISSTRDGMESVARDLCDDYLVKSWGILTCSYSIQKPTTMASFQLQPAWELLDLTFSPGPQETLISEVIPKLLNPPYGFDYNTATLLLCAWIGYHRSEVQFSRKGARIGLTDLESQIETSKTSRDFLNWACVNSLAISRGEPGAVLVEAQKIRRQVSRREPFSQEQADEALQTLDEFVNTQENQPEDERQQATEAANRLRQALEAAQHYDHEAQDILLKLEREERVPELLKLHTRLTKLTHPDELVQVVQPAVSEIQARLFERLEDALDHERQQIGRLQTSREVDSFQQQLDDWKRQLGQAGLDSLRKRAGDMQPVLDERAKHLRELEQEELIHNEINAMAASAGLATLYDYRRRLEEMDLLSDDLRRLRNNKREMIQREIESLEDFAASVVEQVYTLDPAHVHQKQQEIVSQRGRYQGTEQQSNLDQAHHYLELLTEVLAELDSIERRTLNSPEDVEVVQSELEQIAARFEQSLSADHYQLLAQTHEAIAERVQAKQGQAVTWLQRHEQSLEQGAPVANLQRELERPPAFLPSEYQPRLDILRNRVQERLDQDQIAQIEQLFQLLGTCEKQRECLERLQRLLQRASN